MFFSLWQKKHASPTIYPKNLHNLSILPENGTTRGNHVTTCDPHPHHLPYSPISTYFKHLSAGLFYHFLLSSQKATIQQSHYSCTRIKQLFHTCVKNITHVCSRNFTHTNRSFHTCDDANYPQYSRSLHTYAIAKNTQCSVPIHTCTTTYYMREEPSFHMCGTSTSQSILINCSQRGGLINQGTQNRKPL